MSYRDQGQETESRKVLICHHEPQIVLGMSGASTPIPHLPVIPVWKAHCLLSQISLSYKIEAEELLQIFSRLQTSEITTDDGTGERGMTTLVLPPSGTSTKFPLKHLACCASRNLDRENSMDKYT